MADIGVILIGRNEGERLRRALESVVHSPARVVYVDSGSTDGSVAMARQMGVEVVELSTTTPFTAARARNAGFARLGALEPSMRFVQFIDGDCEIDPHWLDKAVAALEARSDVAVVCGRRRERFPQHSIYNRLCDMEWDTPIGEASECGGDAMFRIEPFCKAGGYREDLIAGEEPELCVRLRAAGWKILRLDAEMTLHDADITRFSQWWKRNVRNGHAFAQGAALHGNSPARHWVKQSRSNWIWGAALPLLAVLLAWPTRGLSLVALLALYVLLTAKIFRYELRRGRGQGDAGLYASFCAMSKLPQAYGQGTYLLSRLTGRKRTLIEYKTAVTA
jgi:glycosyltransferase involved in cell wall biosynthesis